MKIVRPYGLLLIAGLLLVWAAGRGASLPQPGMPESADTRALLNRPDSKAKVDSIIAFVVRHRKSNFIDTLFKIGFELVKRLPYYEAEPRLLDAYGVYNRDFSRYALALANHKDSRELARKTGDVRTEIHATNNMGVVYRRLDENGKALTLHMEALRLAEKVGDDYSASVSLNSIGNIHIVLGNYEDAIVYFRKSLPIAQKAHNLLGMAMNYNNIGEAYEYMGKLDSADLYYKRSLFYNKKINNHKGLAICYNSIGNVLKKQNKVHEAILLFERAKRITDTLGDGLYSANNYNNLGTAYLLLKRYDQAKSMFFDALEIARNIGTMTEIKAAYEGLMKANERTRHLDSALFYSKLFKKYGDSIVTESNNRHVRQMEVIYDTEKEKERIAFLEANRKKDSILRKNDRVFLFGALILFLLILTSGILYYLRYRLLERNKRLRQELEIRSQIASDLHDDMGSTLSSIHIFSELLRTSGTNKEELLSKIEANAKDTLDALDDIIWLVKPSNDKFSNLCQHIREYAIPMFQSKGIEFVIDFPESISEIPLPMDTRRNIFLIVKETVNNLVKYSRCTEASIVARDEDAAIFFAVKDNGIGFDADKSTDRNGVKNIRSRAQKINARIKITTACGEGTLVEFWVTKDKPVYADMSNQK